MNRVDTPYDRGADSCTRRSAQLLAILGLVLTLIVRSARKARRR